MKYNWKEYKGNTTTFPNTSRLWQKEIEGVNVNIVEYPITRNCAASYEINIQLHNKEDTPIAEKTINIKIFPYDKLDFKKMEKDSGTVLRMLKKK